MQPVSTICDRPLGGECGHWPDDPGYHYGVTSWRIHEDLDIGNIINVASSAFRLGRPT